MKGGTLRVGTIAGIPQELKFSWAIVFALLAWSLAADHFPLAVPDLPPGSSWSKGILAALLLFASILVVSSPSLARHANTIADALRSLARRFPGDRPTAPPTAPVRPGRVKGPRGAGAWSAGAAGLAQMEDFP